MIEPIRPSRRHGRVFKTVSAVCASGIGVALVLAATAPLAASADPTSAASTTAKSPGTASDAPFTKTVNYLLSQLTPSEEIAVIEKGTDPDPHGQAGYLAGVPRLGIPEIRHADALGINVYADATAFPSRIGLAASFDRAAYSTFGEEVGKQGKALDIDLVYGPQVDMSRYPSWSRAVTTNGEDSYVSSQFTAAEINGIQSTGLMSQVKHVSIYGGQSPTIPSLVSSQAAHEVYLAPAEAAIKDADVSSVMCSYAAFQIVGEQDSPQFACSNSNLMNNILKNELGFKGFITSDYGASKATSDILAGMDNEFSTSNLSSAKLLPLIDLTSSSFDPAYASATATSVARMLYQYERFGLLDNSKIPAADQSDVPQHGDVNSTFDGTAVDKASGDAVALALAEKTGVLLKNDNNAPPLSTSSKVAVVGPTASLMPSAPGAERSRGFGDQNNYTPLKAMKAQAGSSNIVSAPGIDWIGTTVPAANLVQTDGTTPGLTLTTTTNDPTPVTTTSTVTSVAGTTNLVKGYTYTWTGNINVPASDTYQLLLQRPYGTDSGITTAYNKGVRPAAAGTVTLSVDGTPRTLAAPSTVIIQNDFPDGTLASNGQYLGKDNTGANLPLTAGLHPVTFTYKPTATSAQTPTLRFAWAPLAANTAASVSAAQTSDETVIFVTSENAGAGAQTSITPNLANFTPVQNTFVTQVADAAHAAGHKVVVVVNTGGAITMPWADDVDAILNMWFPGEEGGKATSDLLYGVVNPSGKLPMTFPTDDAHTQFTDNQERIVPTLTGSETTASLKWNEGVDVGYRWYTDPTANVNGYQPQFPFGFGLSYTSFAYSGLSVKNASDGGLDVTFTLTNTGTKAGADSPQVYLGASPDLAAPTLDANGIVTAGFQQSAEKLVQFDHIDLAAGASKTETLHVDTQQVSAWDTVGQKWVLGTGDRKVSLGASSEQLVASVTKNVPASVVAPTITTNPVATVSAKEGTSVTLSAAASATPTPTVQWQVSTDKGATWNAIAGATSASYTFTAVAAQNGSLFRAAFTNDLGTVPTTATTLTVTHLALTAPSAVGVTKSVTVGSKTYVAAKSTVTWTAATPATSLGGYQVLDGTKVIAATNATTTSATVTLGAGTHSLSVRALASDPLVTAGDVTSAAIAVTVDKTGAVVKVTKPSNASKASAWKKVSGTANDAGAGAKSVHATIVEKRGSAYYYYTGSTFKKASSKKAAEANAKTITVTVKSGKWTTPLKSVKKGTLIITTKGVDKLGNISSAHSFTYVIKS